MCSKLIFFEQFSRLMRLHISHAGDRLIDQKQLGILREQHSDFEPLLLAVGQAAGEAILQIGQADGLQDFVDALVFARRTLPTIVPCARGDRPSAQARDC